MARAMVMLTGFAIKSTPGADGEFFVLWSGGRDAGHSLWSGKRYTAVVFGSGNGSFGYG
jgi:hypothetical protein